RDANFQRFVDEFKMLYDIDDPVVPEIYDFRVTSQYCYIAMEFFPLGHLGGRLNARLSLEDARRYALEIAHALAIIHAAGVVHRDLKPGNIMLREDGTVALIDFGISASSPAARAEPAPDDGMGNITGTPTNLSPDRARGEGPNEAPDWSGPG